MNYLRRLPKFKFVSPDSMTELCTLVEQATPGEAMLFAGGTDAVLQLRRREMTPAQVIGMKRIAGLDFIRGEEDGGLSIGAMTNLQSLITSPIVQARHGVLGETAVQIGGLELRNVATLGGNIAGALPCADMPAPMMILDARVKLTSKAGERWVGLDDFFEGFGQTKATHGEVLTEFSLAPLAPGSASIYLKYHDRQSMDMTVAGIGAYVEPDPAKEVIKDIRLALAGAAPIVVRAKPAEDILRGKPPSDENLMAAAEAACDQASPRSNSWRASPGYRLDLIRNLTQRAIKAAWDKAAGGEKATS